MTINFNHIHTSLEQNQNEFVPSSFHDYMGQKDLKKRLSLHIAACKGRQDILDHILLFGPPGLGKTTLASIIAHELEAPFKIAHGPALQRTGDLVAILSSLKKGTVFFIDEVHRMAMPVEETLYTAMEQFRIDIIIGQGNTAKAVRLPIQPFTLIGATTRAALLSEPFQTRFGIIEKFDLYHESDLADIVMQTAQFLHFNICHDGAYEIALRSRGTPRIAKKLTRKIRDYAQVQSENECSRTIVHAALDFFGIGEQGLTTVDNQILKILKEHGIHKPVGLQTLAALLGEEAETVELVYEPYLLHKGFIARTPRGRVLGMTSQENLFQKAESL